MMMLTYFPTKNEKVKSNLGMLNFTNKKSYLLYIGINVTIIFGDFSSNSFSGNNKLIFPIASITEL